MSMTKQKLIELCEALNIDPQDAFNAIAESITGRTNPDLHSEESVAKWLDDNIEKLEPAL